MHTKSSRYLSVSFSSELLTGMKKLATQKKCALSFVIRDACIKYLSENNIEVSGIINPAGRGTRSDLREQTRSEERALTKELKERKRKGKL